MQIDRKALFDGVRTPMFGGHLTQTQVDGVNAIVDACETFNVTNLDHVAYILATAFHEAGSAMKPVPEIGRGKGHAYGLPGKHGGQAPYGRGFIQLTWDA